MIEIQCRVAGQVQNVAYRAYVQDSATELGVVGWVMNEANGSVTLLAQADRDVLKDFIEYLHEGSLRARVESVSVDWGTVEEVLMIFRLNMPEIPILFENDAVLVINKPAGLLSHSDGSSNEPSVVDWFLEHCPTAEGVGDAQVGKDGEEMRRSGIVHRLDKDTSGVMILAKTQPAFDHLKLQFQDRRAKKTYRALTYGHMREKWGTIDRPIGRSSKDWRLRSAQRGAKGTVRDAVTDWECLGNGEYDAEPFSYVKLMPKTGRMHQIRVHLKAIDRPIVADPLYAGKKLEQSNSLGMERLALHAHELELVLPDGTDERFVAPLPDDFIVAADKVVE